MDPFYAFLLFAFLLAVDLLAGRAWFTGYYRLGIPVFFARRSWEPTQPAGEMVESLTPVFKGRPEHPTILFKALNDRQIALREVLFENRAGGRYLPVMHSTLRLDPENKTVSVVGLINGYVLIALGYLLYRALNEPSFIPVAALIVLLLVFSYAAQATINRRILNAVAFLRP